MVLSRAQIQDLSRAGLRKEQIEIVVHNLEEAINSKIIGRETVAIVVHNLVNDEAYRRQFFTNPQNFIKEANPQPSP